MQKPIVAIVGRPNVGKSTLFNRLAERRMAIVDDIPGTTRDRLSTEVEWNGVVFDIIDTGGLDPTQVGPGKNQAPLSIGSHQFIEEIRIQAEIAIREADAILFVVDGPKYIFPLQVALSICSSNTVSAMSPLLIQISPPFISFPR